MEELRNKYNNTQVSFVYYGERATGVLKLDGEKTEVVFTTETKLNFDLDDDGWFQLEIEDCFGFSVLLVDAFISGGSRSFKKRQTKIFANYIIFNSENLSRSKKVKLVRFCLEGFNNFFAYNISTNIYLSTKRQSKNISKFIQSETGKNLNLVSQLVAIKRYPTPISFDAESAKYSFFMGGTYNTLGASEFKITQEPEAIITFTKTKSLREAIDNMSDWRNYFCQIAMRDLRTVSVSVEKANSKHSRCPVYIPNLDELNLRGNVVSIHSSDIPLNIWEDRHKHKKVMEKWISFGAIRRTYRLKLNGVIKRYKKIYSPNDVLELCAAVESLQNLSSEKILSADQFKLVKASLLTTLNEFETSQADKEILVSSLSKRRPVSLKSNLECFLGEIEFQMEAKYKKEFIKYVLKIRNHTAHGHASSVEYQPLLLCIRNLLLSLCVLYELNSCGLSNNNFRSGRSSVLGVAKEEYEEFKLRYNELNSTNA